MSGITVGFGADALDGQEGGKVVVRGRVIDAATLAPVPGAVVRHTTSGGAAVADTSGLFALRLDPAGAYVIRVEQLGYETSQATLPSTAPIEVTTITIQPKPLELQGLEVNVTSRLEQRRFLSAEPVRVIGRVRLAELGGAGRELVKQIVPKTRLCVRADGELCYWSRNSQVAVSLCIDEQPAYGGTADLDRYVPADLHSIEVFGSGAHVRVYTTAFMARLLAEGRELKPLEWCTVRSPLAP